MKDKNKPIQLGDLVKLEGLEKHSHPDIKLLWPKGLSSDQGLSVLADKIEHNEALGIADLAGITEGIENVKVDYFGDVISLEQYAQIPKENAELCKELLSETEYSYKYSSLVYIPMKLARVLVNTGETHLILEKLKFLSDEVARMLTQSSKLLSFNELEEISPSLANILADYQGQLNLSGLKKLTPELAGILARHALPLHFRGVEEIDVETAKAIVSYPGYLQLGLKVITPEVAEALAGKKDDLCLPYLHVEDEKIVKGLAKVKGTLSLPIEKLTPGLARAFAQGENYLNWYLSEMDVDVARELAKHKGGMSLDNLEDVSDEVLQILLNGEKLSFYDFPQAVQERIRVLKGIPKDQEDVDL